MRTDQYLAAILDELGRARDAVAGEPAEALAEAILSARQVFVAGAGRSGLMGRAFAMRLMHLGVDAYVPGDTVTPALGAGDLLLAGSGSGETKSLTAMAQKARALSARVALVTVTPESTLGRLADLTVTLPGAAKEETGLQRTTVQPMGSLFEQTLLLFYDALLLRLMEKKGVDGAAMMSRHANLE
ncbi:6-phospho-3-hexuloisomerase [Paenibacillus sp. CC-CFT747]|nr:6-phospho-3-hexuloisomerase [Paenibacillus sp. CC-CFT747]